jgi:hypothetical protein
VLTDIRRRIPAVSTTPSKTQTGRSKPFSIRALQITIESTFATVRPRQRVTKGPGSRAAGVAMAFKLIESAQARWRAVNAPTSSLWSVPAPGSRRGNSSNDPTNQKVISKSRDTIPQVLTIPPPFTHSSYKHSPPRRLLGDKRHRVR